MITWPPGPPVEGREENAVTNPDLYVILEMCYRKSRDNKNKLYSKRRPDKTNLFPIITVVYEVLNSGCEERFIRKELLRISEKCFESLFLKLKKKYSERKTTKRRN